MSPSSYPNNVKDGHCQDVALTTRLIMADTAIDFRDLSNYSLRLSSIAPDNQKTKRGKNLSVSVTQDLLIRNRMPY